MTLPNSQIERHLGTTTMLRALATIAAAAAMLAAAHAQDGAADYPNKPVKIMVTVPAGGGVDTVTRIISEKLQQRWGQPVVIENRAGAGGNIAAEAISATEPDGYTLMASQPAPITTNVFLHKKLNFDPSEIEPIVVMSKIPNVLLVRPDFPAKTAQEFMEYARKNPGKLSYASQGVGTTSHLTAELFQTLTKTKVVHVPYKGTGPALNDLIGSHVDFIFMQLESAIKLHEGGGRRAQPGLRHVERDFGPAENAGRHRRQGQCGRQRSAQAARRAGTLHLAPSPAGRRQRTGDEKLRQGGDETLGRGHPRRERHPDVTPTARIRAAVTRLRLAA